MVLVGNKCDLPAEEREVTPEEGREVAQKWSVPFFESSAKNHVNIDESFEQLVREIRKYRKMRLEKKPPRTGGGGSGIGLGKKKCLLF
jgi:GTPase KRas protein